MASPIERAREALDTALASDELRTIAAEMQRAGVPPGDLLRCMTQVSEPAPTREPLMALRAALSDASPVGGNGAFERFALAVTARHSLDRLPAAPLDEDVKRLWCDVMIKCGDGRLHVTADERRFVGLSKIASLRRFPAGQFDWEVSGLPRSWMPRIRPASRMAQVARTILRWGAFSPAFFMHVTVTQPVPALFEIEAEKSYLRMARSMALQPEQKGLIVSSWLHSPDTFKVTPHLAWLNRVFLDHGGIVALMGRAPLDCGVFHRSPERQRAYDEGRFTPTLGLVVWDRRDMLAWLAQRQELCA